MNSSLFRTEKARIHILDDIMAPQIAEPRPQISEYAPKILSTKIAVDKIKDVIGSGGKVINKIIEETGVKIDIEEDGQVFVYSSDIKGAESAMKMIQDIAREIEVNGIYEGVVTRIMPFGAFVDLGGKEGLLHISKISSKRVEKVEDVLSIGDEVKVKVTEIDSQGRINLSMKDLESNSINSNNEEISE